MATIDSNLDQELRCARSLALWFLRDDGLTERQTDYRLRQAKYVARHRRDAIIYASAQPQPLNLPSRWGLSRAARPFHTACCPAATLTDRRGGDSGYSAVFGIGGSLWTRCFYNFTSLFGGSAL
jgi:hypothetical protein